MHSLTKMRENKSETAAIVAIVAKNAAAYQLKFFKGDVPRDNRKQMVFTHAVFRKSSHARRTLIKSFYDKANATVFKNELEHWTGEKYFVG